MISQIFIGKIWHSRSVPRSYSFTYPAFSFAIDLDEMPSLNAFFPLLGINRFGVYSIFARDYLGGGTDNLKQRLENRIAATIALAPGSKVILLTMPRLLGYVFNPVNFYLILNPSGQVDALVSEVQNTFGEAHLYTSSLISREPDGRGVFSFPKEFYVSPLLEVRGDYEISVAPYSKNLDIRISLTQDEKVCFSVRLWGRGRPLSIRSLLWTLLTRPLVGTLAMLRIHYQAFILYFLRSARIAPKPACCHHRTFRSKPNWLHNLRLRALSFAARFRHEKSSD